MLKDLPPQFWQFFPLICGGLFVASGLGMVISGSLAYNKATDKTDALGFAEAAYYTSSTITMGVGVADVFTGIFGITVALLNKKWLYKVHLVVLLVMAAGNLFVLYDTTVFFDQDYQSSKNLIKETVTTLYGNNSQEGGKELTELVNKLQSETPCCGFSGDEKENIFLKTAWHQNINSNVENLNLPDSCCQVHSDNCRGVTDMESGRGKGFVHKTDCINELFDVIKREMFIVFLEISLSVVMQVVTGTYTAIYLKYGPECQTD